MDGRTFDLPLHPSLPPSSPHRRTERKGSQENLTPPSLPPSLPLFQSLELEGLDLLPSEVGVVAAEVAIGRRLGHDGTLQVQVTLDATVGGEGGREGGREREEGWVSGRSGAEAVVLVMMGRFRFRSRWMQL